jgi:hypothetical protein
LKQSFDVCIILFISSVFKRFWTSFKVSGCILLSILKLMIFFFFLQWSFPKFTFYLSFHNHCLLHWWNNHCDMYSKMNKFIFIKRIKIIHYFRHSCAKKTNSCGQKYFQFFIRRATHKNLKMSRKNANGIQLTSDFIHGNFIIGMNQSLIVRLLLKDYNKSRLIAH